MGSHRSKKNADIVGQSDKTTALKIMESEGSGKAEELDPSTKRLEELQPLSSLQPATGGGVIWNDSKLARKEILPALQVVLLCCMYMAVGPTLILLNKHILKDLDGHGFNYPMFLSSLGLLYSSLVSHFAVRVGGIQLPNQARMTRQTYLTTIVPVGICQAATLALGNAVYMFLTVSFIQMLKAFTPVMVLVVGILFQVEAPEAAICMAVMGICLGTSVASYGEMNMNLTGMLLMFSAEFTEAIRLVLVQRFLKSLRFGVVESLYFMSPAGAVCLLCASIVSEFPSMHRNGAFAQVASNPILFATAGMLGVGVHFLSFMVVQRTNSVTLKVLGTARNAMLVLLSVFWYGELVSLTQFLGYATSIAFFGFYTYCRTRSKA